MKHMVIKGVLMVLVSFLLIVACQSRAPETASLKTDRNATKLIAELERSIPDLMSEARIPGLSIAVIREGAILWTEGFGIKNLKTGEPVNKDTVFEAASLTKPFFAYLVMKIVEEGVLDLDTPLIEYAPREYLEERYIRHPMDLDGFNVDWFNKITARMVLSHSSGLPHGELRRPLPIFFEPGSDWKYSADGYMYLQRVIEYIKNEPLHEIMQKMMIAPLGMQSSSMVWRDDFEASAAVGHNMFGETTARFRKRLKAHSAASLYTTAEDYAKFVAAVLNQEGLNPQLVDEMLTPQISCDENVDWSLGFGLDRTPNGKAFWQWGDYGIFRNYIVAYPEHKIGMVFLTNSFNGLSVCQDLIDLAIGGGEEFGLSFLNYPRFNSPGQVFVRTVVEEGIEKACELFKQFRKESPDEFDEEIINSIGYSLLNSDKVNEAIFVFKRNTETFPGSANTYDSLSDAYIKKKDIALAIESVKKTLEAIPYDKTQDKAFLDNLKKTSQKKLRELQKK